MKNSTLIFGICLYFFSSFVFSSSALAQEIITCEESRKIIGKSGCEFAAYGEQWSPGEKENFVSNPDHAFLWCAPDLEFFTRTKVVTDGETEWERLAFKYEQPQYTFENNWGAIPGYEIFDLSKLEQTRGLENVLCADTSSSGTEGQRSEAEKGQKGIVDYIRKLFGSNKLAPEEVQKPVNVPSQTSQSSAQTATDWVIDTLGVYEPTILKSDSEIDQRVRELDLEAKGTLWERPPSITDEQVKRAIESWDEFMPEEYRLEETSNQTQIDSPFRMDILNGQAEVKYPNENEWRTLKVGDKIPPGSTIFTGVDTTTVLSIKGKGVVEVFPLTELTMTEQGLEQAAQQGRTTTEVYLRRGEIEVNVESRSWAPGSSLQIMTPGVALAVRGTHFWINYNEKNKSTLTGIYEGSVEAKTNDGKTTLVSPDTDKPGLILVTQKVNLVKVFIALAIITSGAVAVALRMRKRKTIKRKL